jgi:acid phosphatase family membrane protein YuiD
VTRAHRPAPGVALKALEIAVLTSIAIQLWKGFAFWARHRRLNFRRFVQTGGMPSSHSASVAALTTAVALEEGPLSTLFGVTFFFSLIVMYDAAGLRRAAGHQARLLNKIVEGHEDTALRKQQLFESLGHTPFEVLVGAMLGVAAAIVWHRLL